MNPDKDYYAILGVAQNVKDKELKSAFRRLAITCHPDHHPGDRQAEERFKELNEAYGILNSPEKRAHYDRRRRERQQQTTRATVSRRPAQTTKSPSRPQSGPSIGPDYAEQVFAGVNDPRFKKVTKVKKNGWRAWLKKVKHKLSNVAEDWGLWKESDQAPWDLHYNLPLSPEAACDGVEVYFRHEVDGQPRELLIKVPPGIKHGSLLRLAGQGGLGPSGGKGDLILEILVRS